MNYNTTLEAYEHVYFFDDMNDDGYYAEIPETYELNEIAMNAIESVSGKFDVLSLRTKTSMDGAVITYVEPNYVDYNTEKIEFGNPAFNYKKMPVDLIANYEYTLGDVIGAAVAWDYGLPAFVSTPDESAWKHLIDLYFYEITGWEELEEYADEKKDAMINGVYADVHKLWQEYETVLESELKLFKSDEVYLAPIEAVDEYIAENSIVA